jgi:GNAT superfamily N-acetyltransferase
LKVSSELVFLDTNEPMSGGINHGYRIRLTCENDIPLLQAIERDAVELFRSIGIWSAAYEGVLSREDHQGGIVRGTSWVVTFLDDEPCGFALCRLVEGHLHLQEMDVGRAHQRRGLGRMLLASVIDHARWRYDPVITLTTNRDVPWNGPFYRRHGFLELDPARLTGELAEIIAHEIAAGLDPKQRCAMAKRL